MLGDWNLTDPRSPTGTIRRVAVSGLLEPEGKKEGGCQMREAIMFLWTI